MQKSESKANEMLEIGDLSNLSPEKLQELESVLASILTLPLARETYAQIIDGNPTRTPSALGINPFTTLDISDDQKPSDRAMQQYEEFRRTFAPQGLKIDLQVSTPLSQPNFTSSSLTRHS